MNRDTITVPPHVLLWTNMAWDIDWRGQSAGDATGGLTRTVFNGFPRWVGEPQAFVKDETLRQWRAIRASAQGRANIYRMQMVDPAGYKYPNTPQNGTTFEDGGRFSDGQGFLPQQFALSIGGHAKGAEEIRVDMSSISGAPSPNQGQIMSHDDWPFMVNWVLPVSGTIYDIGVQMPLRAAIADGDPILMQGVGRFEAVGDDMGAVPYGPAHYSRPKLQFREVLRR